MSGETQNDLDREFFNWLQSLTTLPGSPLPHCPKVDFPIRWLPGSSVAAMEPLVQELAACVTCTLCAAPCIVGIEGPCDLFVFHQIAGTPAVLWGARGGNTHAADEYVQIDSLVDAAKALLVFVCHWCGVA